MLVYEGRWVGTFLILVLLGLHRYAGMILRRPALYPDHAADWTGVRAITTVCCFGLPFYLALTIS
jgi:hypothetical protein